MNIWTRRLPNGTGSVRPNDRATKSQAKGVIQLMRWTLESGQGQSVPMAQLFECNDHWRAIDERRNIARDYRLSVSVDLFGWFIVERHWGRIGSRGQSVINSFSTRAAAERFVASIRIRRAGAKKRIGVGYERV